MRDPPLDEFDRQILYCLQGDARNNTISEIGELVNLSPSAVGKRISQLEADGIITRYDPGIDYDRAGFPLHVLFVCTTSITERAALIEKILELQGVVNVKELMTGEENIHIEVVGEHSEDITDLATAITDLGVTVNEEILIKTEYRQPTGVFRTGRNK